MKITITLTDTESGHVNIESFPHMRKLAEIARGGDLTPAEGYALAAIAKIIKDAQEQVKEQVKAKFDAGMIPALPSTRRMFK